VISAAIPSVPWGAPSTASPTRVSSGPGVMAMGVSGSSTSRVRLSWAWTPAVFSTVTVTVTGPAAV